MTNKNLPYQLALIYLVNKRIDFKNNFHFYNQKHITNYSFKTPKFFNHNFKKYLSTPYK
jgi:hypothetical protein